MFSSLNTFFCMLFVVVVVITAIQMVGMDVTCERILCFFFVIFLLCPLFLFSRRK